MKPFDVNSSGLIYLALSILYSRDNSAIVPEICYFLKVDQIMTFIKMFGGSKIYIPTADEFHRDLQSILYVYHTITENMSDEKFAIKYDLDGYKMRAIKIRAEQWQTDALPEDLAFLSAMKGINSK